MKYCYRAWNCNVNYSHIFIQYAGNDTLHLDIDIFW